MYPPRFYPALEVHLPFLFRSSRPNRQKLTVNEKIISSKSPSYCDNSFTTNFITTIGIDFKIKTIKCQGKTLKLQVWDTAGQERFKTICTAYYRGAQGIFLLYSMDDKKSFEHVGNWLKQIQKNASENVCKVLLANKCDLPAEKKVNDVEDGRRFAEEQGVSFYETSAKTGVGVEEAFQDMATQVLRLLDAEAAEDSNIPEDVRNAHRTPQKVQLGGDDFSSSGGLGRRKKCC